METTMYDEGRNSAKKMKLEMSLDLQSPDQFKKFIKQENNELLCTPDLGMFMLTSPDLERFIMQQNGMVLTTPTPTSQILFPKSVTEEQEAYARGFMDALGELHRNNGKSSAPPTTTISIPAALNLSYQPADQKQTTALNTANKKLVQTNQKVSLVPAQQQKTFTIAPSDIIEEEVPPAVVFTTLRTSKSPRATANTQLIFHSSSPQTRQAFSARSVKSAPAINPEEAKLEKKRARNRLAATRCRNRKLERISRLEDRVAELKSENGDLTNTAATLREEVFRLKQSIIEHANQGCHVMISHNLLV